MVSIARNNRVHNSKTKIQIRKKWENRKTKMRENDNRKKVKEDGKEKR